MAAGSLYSPCIWGDVRRGIQMSDGVSPHQETRYSSKKTRISASVKAFVTGLGSLGYPHIATRLLDRKFLNWATLYS
jgi:hypothetical protein